LAKLRNAAERRPLRQRALVWIEQHCDAAADACGRLCGAPLASALTVAVIGIALTLPATLAVIVENTRLAARGFDAALDVFGIVDDRIQNTPFLPQHFLSLLDGSCVG
jgi:hypothetical protein